MLVSTKGNASKGGIYLITIVRPGKLPLYYVGQTNDFSRRKKEHRFELKKNTHANSRVQCAANKYGLPNVHIELLYTCDMEELSAEEQWCLDEMYGYERTLNLSADACSNRGYKKSTAARKAQSLRQTGERNPMFGKPWSHQRRASTAERMRGGGNHFHGKKHTDAARALMSANASGRRQEVREKISKSLKGKKLPIETIEKLRTCHPTKPVVGLGVGVTVRFSSIGEAGRSGFHKTHIAECCEGKRKTHKGYRWEYAS
jgi:group I intron endonuclease